MTTTKKIEQLEQKINSLEAKKALAKLKQRKQDTREKIQLGGLVKKANLDTYPKNVILGALTYVSEQLSDNDFFDLCKHKGTQLFLESNKDQSIS